MVPKALLLLILLSSTLFSNGQSNDIFKPDSIKKEIDAVPITSTLHIDGLMNEPEWKLAKPSPRFIQIEPYQGNFQTRRPT